MDKKYRDRQVTEIWSEVGRFKRMLQVELANCEAWHRQGTISTEEIDAIRAGARFNLATYRPRFAVTRHDVSSFVHSVAGEIKAYAQSIGLKTDPGRWVHYNMTSYDAWDTALAMQIVETLQILLREVRGLRRALRKRGQQHWNTVCNGRTHGLHAEPTTFGAKLANYDDDLARFESYLIRLLDEWQIVKISGPVGTHENIPESVELDIAAQLGKRPINIATQLISRTRVLGYLDLLNEIGGLIEKIATDIRDLQKPEVYEVEEHFPSGAEGSSIMVHKHNPEVCERCCSLARELAGYVIPARMNVVTWHERDLANSANERNILPDAAHALVYIVGKMTWVIDTLHIHPKRMAANLDLTQGLVRSGVVLNRMVEQGADRSKAREIILNHVNFAWDCYREGEPIPSLKERLIRDTEVSIFLSEGDITDIFKPDYDRLLQGVKVGFRRVGWTIPN